MMSNIDLVPIIIDMFRELLTYMLPIIGLLSGISLVLQMLYTVTLGASVKAGRSL